MFILLVHVNKKWKNKFPFHVYLNFQKQQQQQQKIKFLGFIPMRIQKRDYFIPETHITRKES